MTGPEHIETAQGGSDATVSIDKELKVLADVSTQMSSRFMAMSPQERRDWVVSAEHLLHSTNEQRIRFGGDFRSNMHDTEPISIETERNNIIASFDALFEPILPARLREELTSAAQAISDKRPDWTGMTSSQIITELNVDFEGLVSHEMSVLRKNNAILSRLFDDDESVGNCNSESLAFFVAMASTILACGSGNVIGCALGMVSFALATEDLHECQTRNNPDW
jgi:hypothetical protein